MQKHGREFVCGLLVDFADGQAGRSDLIGAGSRERCLQAAQDLMKARVSGNRPLAAAHIVIVSRDEWNEFYVASDDRPSDVPQQAALAASRTSLELTASQLRAWMPASEAAQTAAMAFVRRGASELVNHIGKDRAKAYLRQLLDETEDDLSGSRLTTGRDGPIRQSAKTAVRLEGRDHERSTAPAAGLEADRKASATKR